MILHVMSNYKYLNMTTSQQRVYLITEAQKEALLSYMQNRPYKEVAAGIEFLMNAPTAVLNVTPQDNEELSVKEINQSEGIAEVVS